MVPVTMTRNIGGATSIGPGAGGIPIGRGRIAVSVTRPAIAVVNPDGGRLILRSGVAEAAVSDALHLGISRSDGHSGEETQSPCECESFHGERPALRME